MGRPKAKGKVSEKGMDVLQKTKKTPGRKPTPKAKTPKEPSRRSRSRSRSRTPGRPPKSAKKASPKPKPTPTPQPRKSTPKRKTPKKSTPAAKKPVKRLTNETEKKIVPKRTSQVASQAESGRRRSTRISMKNSHSANSYMVKSKVSDSPDSTKRSRASNTSSSASSGGWFSRCKIV